MADARSARRTAEKVARRRWPAAWSGPPASRGWRRPARQEAADALAAPAEAGRQLVQAAEAAALRDRAQAEVATADAGYAGAWQAARDAGAAARHGLPPAGRYARRPPPGQLGGDGRHLPRHHGVLVRESAMAGRTPPGLRGWWRYSRLVGWRVTVLVTAVVISALGAGGVLPGDEGDWTEVAVIGGGLLLGMLALGGVRAERARRYGCW